MGRVRFGRVSTSQSGLPLGDRYRVPRGETRDAGPCSSVIGATPIAHRATIGVVFSLRGCEVMNRAPCDAREVCYSAASSIPCALAQRSKRKSNASETAGSWRNAVSATTSKAILSGAHSRFVRYASIAFAYPG